MASNGAPEIPCRTIFACVRDPAVEAVLERAARELGAAVHWNSASLDIVATPAFVRIVDRRVLGPEDWKAFESYCDEIDLPEPTIVIDELPVSAHYAVAIDPSSHSGLMKIARMLQRLTPPRCGSQGGCSQS